MSRPLFRYEARKPCTGNLMFSSREKREGKRGNFKQQKRVKREERKTQEEENEISFPEAGKQT